MINKFASLRVPDQLMIIFAITVVICSFVGMAVYSNESIKTSIRRKLAVLIVAMEQIGEYFSDDEPFNAEWMKAKEWRETRI